MHFFINMLQFEDFTKIPEGAIALGQKGLYMNGKIIGPVPMIEFESYEDYAKAKEDYFRRKEISLELNRDAYKKSAQLECYRLAKLLATKSDIRTTDEKIREIYIYKDGLYVPAENILGAKIQEIFQELSSAKLKREMLDKIKDFTLIKRGDFNPDANFINLENGVYDIKNRKLIPHSPEYLFLTKIPVKFDPSADCLKIKEFLKEILDPSSVRVIQEWAGYCLYRKYFIKKAMIFFGERDTGKTTLLRLLSKFIGEKNISGVSLQRIGTDKFATSQLYAKHINVYDDLSAKDVNDNGVFKIATGGGEITGEYKYGNQFQFYNHSKLTFACNTIPNVSDTNDEAYFNRWIVICFSKQIANPNPFLFDELTTEFELSGFLNFALDGLFWILEKRSFSYQKDPDEIKAEMLKSSSPIANFAYDLLERGENEDWISKQDLYSAFTDYARNNDLPIAPINDFGKKIQKYASYMGNSKKGADTGWRNVRLKNATNQGEESSFEALTSKPERLPDSSDIQPIL